MLEQFGPIPTPPDHAALYEILIAELTDFAIFLISPAGQIISWNPGVERLLQYSPEEWLGRTFETIFLEEDRALNKPAQEMTTAMREGRSPDIRWHQKKDGSRLYVDGTLVALKDDEGKVLGFSKVMRDITLRKQAEDEKEKLLAELSRSNDELSLFAHLAAHDLSSPLRTITSHTQILQRRLKDQLDQPTLELMNTIVAAADRMGQLIDALLNFAQLGHAQIEFCHIPLETVVCDALINIDLLIRETGADLEYSELPFVNGDALQLVQLVQNLVANALKYRRQEVQPRVRISAKKADRSWIIAIEDNGEGISPDYRQTIFEPFKRLHGSDVPGTGIGLALCKKIVERHGGKIWVESEPGKGSTFFFSLPSA
jgi:PAS domain S-box-containing protein